MERKEEVLHKLSHFIIKNSLLLPESISGLNLDLKEKKNTKKREEELTTLH